MWQKNNSLIAKIMLFMSGLLVLSGIILLTLLRYTGDVLAENRQKEIGHLLNIYETSLEYGLNSTDNNLLSIAQEQKSLEELSNAEEARRYYAATDLLDIIKRLRSNNDTVDMLIAIGNYENDVSDASARLTVKDRDAIIAYMNDRRAERKDGEKMPTGTQGWIVVTVGKEQYLLRSYDTQDYSLHGSKRTLFSIRYYGWNMIRTGSWHWKIRKGYGSPERHMKEQSPWRSGGRRSENII